MSNRSFDLALRDWLEEGSDRTSPGAVDAVLLAIRTTPQERALRILWPFGNVRPSMRLATGVVAIAIAGIVAVALLPGVGPVGPGPSPSPSPKPTPSPAPTFSVGQLPAFSLDLPADWSVGIDLVDYYAALRPDPVDPGRPLVGIDVVAVNSVYVDLCDTTVGSTRARDIIAWLRGLDGDGSRFRTYTGLITNPVPIAGQESSFIELDPTYLRPADCRELNLWPLSNGPYPLYVGERKRFYAVNVGGQPVVIVIVAPSDTYAGVKGEADQVLETLRFDDVPATNRPS